MPDPVENLRNLIPRQTDTRRRVTTRRRSGLAALPPARPFVSQRARQRQALDAVKGPLHSKSLGAQIGGVFGGLIPGAAHLTAMAGRTLIGSPRAALDLARGDLSPQEFSSLVGSNPFQTGDEQLEGLRNKYSPLTNEIIRSNKQTVGRVAQLGPVEVASVGGDKVVTYGDAIDRGEIVATLLNDVGNISIAGGVAGKALGAGGRLAEAAGATETAARLGKAADVTKFGARLGGKAADAPLYAAGGVLKGGKSVWRAAGQRAEQALYRSMPKESAISRRLVRVATPEGRLLKQAAVDERIIPTKLADFSKTEVARDAGLLEPTGLGGWRPAKDPPSLVEQEVGLTRAVGVSQLDRMVADQLGPDAALAAHVAAPVNKNMVVPGETMTREGQALGHQYEAGLLDPETMKRIDKVEAAYRKQAGLVTEKALKGHGRKPLDPAYTGDQPLYDAMVIRMEDAGMPQADIDIAFDLVDRGQATWADLAQQEPLLADIILDPQVYPAPWREAMHVAQRGTEEGAVGLPRTPEEMLAAGIERPAYMSGKRRDPSAPRSKQMVATSEGWEGGIRSISAEHHRETMGHGQYSLAHATESLSAAINTTEFNAILTKYMQDNQLRAPGDIITQPHKLPDGSIEPGVDWATLHDEAKQLVNGRDLGGMSPRQIVAEVKRERGRMVHAELQKRGYDVLNGNRSNPKVGDFDPALVPGKHFGWNEITPDSIVLPTGLKDRLMREETGAATNVVLLANMRINKEWKGQVLPLNAHWTLGDSMSNLLTAWQAGRITPVEMLRAQRAIKRLDPAVANELFNRPEFVKTGLKMQAAQELNPGLMARPQPRVGFRTIRKAQNAGFRFNEFANRVQRQQYLYAKLTKELRARGLSDSVEGVGAGKAQWKDPAVQNAINDVVNDSNKTLGTWEEMSPQEQRFATQVFPFWSWIRHINTLAARTAVDNPTRMLWTLRVGALGMAVTPDDLPEWMRGSVDTPFGRVGLNWANPFYDVGSGALLSPSTALRSTSPLIKFGTTAVTGRDLNRNLNMVSHRPGDDPNQIASAFYGLTQASPFSRGALNLAPTAEVPAIGLGLGPHRRYGSGQTILTPGTDQPADTQSRLKVGARVFNLPVPEPEQVVPTVARVRRKSGLGRSGLGSGRLKNTGLNG